LADGRRAPGEVSTTPVPEADCSRATKFVPNPILPTRDEFHDRYLHLPSSKPVARELQDIASEPLLPQRASRNDSTSFILSDLELSPEDEHLFNNLHEELGASDWLDL